MKGRDDPLLAAIAIRVMNHLDAVRTLSDAVSADDVAAMKEAYGNLLATALRTGAAIDTYEEDRHVPTN